MRRTAFTILLTAGLLSTRLQAQRIPEPLSPSSKQPPASISGPIRPQTQRSSALLALGGVLAGTAGVFGGAIIGAEFTKGNCEDCFLEGLVYGSVAGGSILLPLGVHLANGHRGNYGASLLASCGLGVAGLGLAVATNEGGFMIPVPVLQLVSSILIERAKAR